MTMEDLLKEIEKLIQKFEKEKGTSRRSPFFFYFRYPEVRKLTVKGFHHQPLTEQTKVKVLGFKTNAGTVVLNFQMLAEAI